MDEVRKEAQLAADIFIDEQLQIQKKMEEAAKKEPIDLGFVVE